MTKLEIVPHPHPALRWKSREVTRIDAELRQMVEQMFDLMYASRGIGLAANQVALPYRLFVINPQITRRNGSEEDEEGCLSLPEIYGPVTRATRIVVDAFDLSGQQFEVDLEDLDARVVQHEYDHIEGVMFTDRVAPAYLPKLQPLIKDLELQFRNRQKEGTIPSDDELKAQLAALQKARTGG